MHILMHTDPHMKGGVNANLWRDALESKGFKMSWTITGYIECYFNKYKH